MESWQQLINTALLGTNRQALPPLKTAGPLTDALQLVSNTAPDREALLLQTGAILMNYRQAGCQSLYMEDTLIRVSPDEERPYCSQEAVGSLTEAIELGSNALTKYWLELCSKAGHLIPPALLPMLMDKAIAAKQLRTPLMTCYGKRGEWLALLNPDWELLIPGNEMELSTATWETGTTGQRCAVLNATRKEDPDSGLTLLMETWKQENAATRAALLECLETGLNSNDIPWLQQLTAEKSIKVKEKAWELLRLLPESDIVQQYWQLIKSSITLQNGHIGITEPELPLPADIYKSGIDKLPASAMNLTDELYQLQQLIAAVPCSFFQEYLQEDITTCVQLLSAAGFEKPLLKAAITFKETAWITALLQQTSEFYPDVFHLIAANDLQLYAMRFVEKEGSAVILKMGESSTEWSIPLTEQIFKFIAMHPYSYNRNYFLELAHLLPTAVLQTEDKNIFGDILYNQTAWKSLRDNLSALLACKSAMHHQFQAK
ncbi:DUF5691 domain-containing protein [Chitinophaga sp. Cy-1792]|uniref:DUF5691 domain-containing protein n=1 Tax=Chitinophaga sp. Cy-1792 TaxID=2608339 RepID=UPI00141DE354|nr:DUF5691 domain-containing protein [Chitinophaga sp. Cy-1792]NIG54944.1 hypothetical protein [Chitinophaga sp. Cy-1792]